MKAVAHAVLVLALGMGAVMAQGLRLQTPENHGYMTDANGHLIVGDMLLIETSSARRMSPTSFAISTKLRSKKDPNFVKNSAEIDCSTYAVDLISTAGEYFPEITWVPLMPDSAGWIIADLYCPQLKKK